MPTASVRNAVASTPSAQSISLRKLSAALLEPCYGRCEPLLVATFGKNLESLGFAPSRELFDRLKTCTPDRVAAFAREITPILAEMVGGHREFIPMYPNFPSQVMDASDLELYLNAMAHYWGSFVADVLGDPGIRILPHYEKDDRPPLGEGKGGKAAPCRMIGLASREDFEAIFPRLAGSNGSLSESDKAIVSWFADNYRDDLQRLLPAAIPQKENLAFLAGALLEQGGDVSFLLPHIRTATDVLRLAVALSEGDVSLAKATKFRNFTRRERRFLLQAIESGAGTSPTAPTEDMLRWKGRWLRLGEILHPREFARCFPRTCAAFDVLRNDRPFATFNAKVESGLVASDIEGLVGLLRTRPGIFARRLDHCLRVAGEGRAPSVADAFLDVAAGVSTPVLLQAFHHFKTRSAVASAARAFFPKGDVGKVQVEESPLPPLPDGIGATIADGIRGILVARFRALPSLGKSWIDEAIRSHIVPFAQRSASKSLRTLTRGSRVALPEGGTIRFFLWWKDGTTRTDIDLSCVMYGAAWDRLQAVAYYNLRDGSLGCYHSGDITSAPDGACEFIDMDLEAMVGGGIRYVAMSLNSYTQQPYCDLPECFAGWMARDEPRSGEVFEARTVVDKVDLTSDTTVSIPVIIDVVDRCVIWADIALKSQGPINNVHRNGDNLARMAKAIASLNRPNLHDLFSMHVEARGSLVETAELADTVFSLHSGITPSDTGRILSEFLS
jgi:hypothetical protein